jgi:CRISPR/Cas system-associated exonuclease Cas4 (RecB family)
MSDPIRLSVSKTKTFVDCKAKYKYVYVEKLPRKDWEFHTFGKFCHKVLEDFHNAYIEHDSVQPYNIEMGNAWKSAWKEYKEAMTPDMKKDCWAIIDQYLRKICAEKKSADCIPNVISCEKKFEINIDNKIILNGMIDRIQIDADGVIHVCDYKTVKNKKYLKNDFFQLLTYAYVIISEDPSVQRVRASYILLRHDFEYITVEFTVPEILKIRETYLEYADKMQTETEFTPNPTALCNFCDYLNLCPEGKTKSFNQNIYGEVNW